MTTIRKLVNTLAIIVVTFAVVRASLYIEAMIKEEETLQPFFILVDIVPEIGLVETWEGERLQTDGWRLYLQNSGGLIKNVNVTIPDEPTDVRLSNGTINEPAYYKIIQPKEVFVIYAINFRSSIAKYAYLFPYPEILIKYEGGQQTVKIWEERA